MNTDKTRMVDLSNSFETVWNTVSGKAIELETEERARDNGVGSCFL
jgi:hypothetical protein